MTLERKSILLTGATGFIGKALLRHIPVMSKSYICDATWHFLSRDPTVFAQRHAELALPHQNTWHQGDILKGTIPAIPELTHVVHAAADTASAGRLSPLEHYDQIVQGTRNMLDLAVASGAKRFLLISSGAVYGRQPADVSHIHEDFHGIPDPLCPANVYGIAKRAAEHICAIYSERYAIEVIVARCFSFVGQDIPLAANFAIGNFIRDALLGNEIIIKGDGRAVRSYMDQRDLAEWLISLLFLGKAGEAYNVGSDEPITMADLAHLVRDLLNVSVDVRILGKPESSLSDSRSRYIPSVTKSMSQLGLNLQYTLRQAIVQTGLAAHLNY